MKAGRKCFQKVDVAETEAGRRRMSLVIQARVDHTESNSCVSKFL